MSVVTTQSASGRIASGGAVRRVETRAAVGVRYAGMAMASAWLVLPLVPVVLWAFAQGWTFPAALPTEWGLGGWSSAWHQGAGSAALTSLGLGTLVAALATPAGAAAGLALTVASPRLARVATILLILPIAIPPFAVVMGLSSAALRAQVPALAAVVAVLVVAALPYTTYVMRAAYADYDLEFEDAARTLGATRRQVLRRVHLPLIAPALATAAFLAFLVAWSDYIVTLLLGAGGIVTLPLMLASAAAGSGNDPTIASLALLTIAPPTLLLVIVKRLARTKGHS